MSSIERWKQDRDCHFGDRKSRRLKRLIRRALRPEHYHESVVKAADASGLQCFCECGRPAGLKGIAAYACAACRAKRIEHIRRIDPSALVYHQ